MRKPSTENVDLRGIGSADSPRVRFFDDIVRFATAARSGTLVRTPIRCRKRPGRVPCPGLVTAYRQDAPPLVRWQCDHCGSSGSIVGWQRSAADLGRLPGARASAPPGESVLLAPDLHAVLRDIARTDPQWSRVVFTATVGPEGVELHVTADQRQKLAQRALEELVRYPASRRADRLFEAVALLHGYDPRCSESFLELGRIPLHLLFGNLAAGGVPSLTNGVEPVQEPDSSQPSARRAPTDARTYRIKVTLRDVRPPVWRRLLVPAGLRLPELHRVLQVALGWFDCHLHAFRIGERMFAPPESDTGWGPIGEDSNAFTLADIAPGVGSRFVYEYDFGDGWCHDVLVEEVRDDPCTRIRCLKGKRACPPEDCGGPWGYAELLEAMRDARHDRHAEVLGWLGSRIDPEAFDQEWIDAELQRLPVNV